MNPLLDPGRPFPGHISDWAAWLEAGLEEQTAARLRANTSTGRPTGNDDSLRELETRGKDARFQKADRGRFTLRN